MYKLTPVDFEQQDVSAQARACVVITGVNGVQYGPYAIQTFTIDKNCHGATNTASFDLPYNSNPDWTQQLFIPGSAPSYSPIIIDIYAGFPASPGSEPSTSGLSLRFHGVMDEYDPEDMDKTHFQCRSVAAPLTTDRITTAIQNMTTTTFLKQICAQYDIKYFIDPQLTDPVTLANVYAQEFLVGLKNLVKWDVLQRSSIFDDVDVWEDDGIVYYVHPWNVARYVPTSKPIMLKYGTNVKSFHGKHSSQFSRTISVQVRSYRSKVRISTSTIVESVVGGVSVSSNTKTAVSNPQFGTNNGTSTVYNDDGTVTYRSWTQSGGGSSGSTTAMGESGKEVYNIPVPNQTPTQCQALAMKIWRQISMHEYIGEITLAMTPTFLPLCTIESRPMLAGYGMQKFNTEYWPRTMTEQFDGPSENSADAGGWTVKFSCVNHTLPLSGGG